MLATILNPYEIFFSMYKTFKKNVVHYNGYRFKLPCELFNATRITNEKL